MKNVQHFPISNSGCMSCGHTLCAKKVALFSNMSDLQLKTILELIERKHYKKGDIILRTGEVFDRLYIVNLGTLKASTYQEDGREQILYLLNEGDSFGEMALLKKEIAHYDLIAIKECFLCTIPKKSFDIFLKENPEIMFSILESVHEKITSLEKLVQAIASSDADVRLKFLIQQLCKQTGKKVTGGILVDLPLTREDMANFVGVTRETISRKITQLASSDALEFLDNKQLLVKDLTYFEV